MSIYRERMTAAYKNTYVSTPKGQSMISSFGGINVSKAAQPNEAVEARNCSAREYPVLSTSPDRGCLIFKDVDEESESYGEYIKHLTPGKVTDAAVVDGDLILSTENGVLMRRNRFIGVGTSDSINEIENIVMIGKQIFCLPCCALVDADISAGQNAVRQTEVFIIGQLQYSIYTSDGKALPPATAADAAPSGAKTGDYWFNTADGTVSVKTESGWDIAGEATDYLIVSGTELTGTIPEGLFWANTENDGFYRYADGEFVNYDAYLILIRDRSGDHRFTQLKDHDGVRRGPSSTEWEETIIRNADGDGDWIAVDGILKASDVGDTYDYVQRKKPILQFAVENDNRIWSCRYGLNMDGEFVNEIYASALGDPLNWFVYDGRIEDSFTASVGAPGAWTGAAVLNGKVIFFKEDCYFVVSGNMPSNYTVEKIDAPGVERFCEKSLVTIDGNLYYKSTRGIMRLTANGYPQLISEAIGPDRWTNAAAGTDGRRYFIQLWYHEPDAVIYVYDTKLGIWHMEDGIEDLVMFLPFRSALMSIHTKESDRVFKRVMRPKYIDMPEDTPMQIVIRKLFELLYFNITEYDAMGDRVFLTDEEIQTVLDNNLLLRSLVHTVENAKQAAVTRDGDGNIIYDEKNFYENDFAFQNVRETKRTSVPVGTNITDFSLDQWHITPGMVETEVIELPRREFRYDTGIFGLADPENKVLTKVEIRAEIGEGAWLGVAIMENNDGEWRDITDDHEARTGTVRINEVVANCDTFRLSFYGYGDVAIYSVTVTTEEGGDGDV